MCDIVEAHVEAAIGEVALNRRAGRLRSRVVSSD
jgi:hypothetical protein